MTTSPETNRTALIKHRWPAFLRVTNAAEKRSEREKEKKVGIWNSDVKSENGWYKQD